MKDDKRDIKYTLGANSEVAHADHDHSSASTSFEISSKDQTALTVTPQKRARRHFGTHLPIYWKNGEPVFTIGPHCNLWDNSLVLISYYRAVLFVYVASFNGSRSTSDILCCSWTINHFGFHNVGNDFMGKWNLPLYCAQESRYSQCT